MINFATFALSLSVVAGSTAFANASLPALSFKTCELSAPGPHRPMRVLELAEGHLKISDEQGTILIDAVYLDLHQAQGQELESAREAFRSYFGVNIENVVSGVQTKSNQIHFVLGETLRGVRIAIYDAKAVFHTGFLKDGLCR